MPTYEYLCPDGHLTEKLRRMDSRNDPVECSSCGQQAKPALVNPPNLKLFWDRQRQEHSSMAVLDDPAEVWRGVPGLEDSDGINPTLYDTDPAYRARTGFGKTMVAGPQKSTEDILHERIKSAPKDVVPAEESYHGKEIV